MGDTTAFANTLIGAGLCALPCKMPEKKPFLKTWTKFQSILPTIGQHSFNGALGIITGKISGNLFVLDIDLKYDLTGTLVERLEIEIGAELWDRIFQSAYIQKTVNNGLHIFLRCEEIEGNQKLARRHATSEELAKNPDDKIKVLLETRAEGGFIVIAPTAGYTAVSGSLLEVGFISIEDKQRLFEACRSFNEVFEEVKPPASKKLSNDLPGLPPWEDYNQRADVPSYLQSQGWTYIKTKGDDQHFCRPGKRGTTSGTYNPVLNLFRNFSTSTPLEGDKSYSPSSLFTYLECNGDFSEAARRLYSLGYGERSQPTSGINTRQKIEKQPEPSKHFKDYILKEEPTEEKGIIYVDVVNVLSDGNVLVIFGPPKARKTGLAVNRINEFRLRTAYVDSEQGRMHSWRLGKRMPTADVFHLRGEDLQEIIRVINEIILCKEYQLLVIDNVRDLVTDFNDVTEAGKMELFLKKISEQLPVICIVHENKNSKSPQGHLGHSLNKIAQTTIRVSLADVEDPAAGSIVQCVVSRDEPFKQCFFSSEGKLCADNLIKTAGKSMLMDDVLRRIGGKEYTRNELNETYAEIFDITPKTAANEISKLKRLHPGIITERKEGKTKIFNVSSTVK